MVQACVRFGFSIWLIRTLWINVNDSKNCTRWEKYLLEIPFNRQTSQLSIKWNCSFFCFFFSHFLSLSRALLVEIFSFFCFLKMYRPFPLQQHIFFDKLNVEFRLCAHWVDVWNHTNSICSLKVVRKRSISTWTNILFFCYSSLLRTGNR